MALLQATDDGCDGGEIFRLRRDETLIGRSSGDILVPHDISMAPRHARIDRLPDGGWRLSDLGSEDGTFVRVVRSILHRGSVIMVGSTRLAFEEGEDGVCLLVEKRSIGLPRRHMCLPPGGQLGRPGCGCTMEIDDEFVSPIHARFQHTPRGWIVENRGANGLWVRIDGPVALSGIAQFQCGEQRFVFTPLPPRAATPGSA
jgi:pSer/pThr/pTyr-binding forkhead associated (FHA) protein